MEDEYKNTAKLLLGFKTPGPGIPGVTTKCANCIKFRISCENQNPTGFCIHHKGGVLDEVALQEARYSTIENTEEMIIFERTDGYKVIIEKVDEVTFLVYSGCDYEQVAVKVDNLNLAKEVAYTLRVHGYMDFLSEYDSVEWENHNCYTPELLQRLEIEKRQGGE